MSYPAVILQCMTSTTNEIGVSCGGAGGADCQVIHKDGCLACEWCGTRFDPRSHRGRTPRFCRASHRVRACERRRGLLRAGSAPFRPTMPEASRQGPVGIPAEVFVGHQHEPGSVRLLGTSTFRRLRVHRIRVGGVPQGRFVPSLCGAMVQPVGNPVQAGGLMSQCGTCERLAPLHPVDPRWWSAMTQRVAGALIDDIGSTILAVGQAVAGVRDRDATLLRAERDLRRFATAVGLREPLPPSLHRRSVLPN